MDRFNPGAMGTRGPAVDAGVGTLRLAELIGALSYALDMTEGQPKGHCVRSCWIGMHIGRHIGLDDRQLWELYYTLLLKDLGCSSNAARICELYLSDDLQFKRDFKTVGRQPAADAELRVHAHRHDGRLLGPASGHRRHHAQRHRRSPTS